MKSKEKKFRKGMVAMTQIFILVIGIFAFTWLIGGITSVSAGGDEINLNDCASGFSSGGKNYVGVCKDYGTLKSTYAKTHCPIDYSGSVYIANHCGGPSTTQYCCATPNPVVTCNSKKGNCLDPSQYSCGGTWENYTCSTGSCCVGSSSKRGDIQDLSIDPKGIINTILNGFAGAGASKVVDAIIPPANPAGLATTGSNAKKIMENKLTYESSGVGTTLGITNYVMGPLAAIAAGYAANRIFKSLAHAVGANADWSNGLQGIGTGIGVGATLGFGFPALMGQLATDIGGGLTPFLLATGIGAVVGIVVALFTFSTTEKGTVVYYCNQWQPITGGKNCELCNNKEVPCSEYQCKSLGQACNFVQSDPENKGEPFCYWENPDDIDAPIIKPNSDVLTVGYTYSDPEALSPSDKGVKINTNKGDGCLSPFSKVTFGVTLNEAARCKIGFDKQTSYDNMGIFMGGTDFPRSNHTQTLMIPEINQTVGKDNFVSVSVRCQDLNGNSNPSNFVFEMCVQKGPDPTAPIIYETSIVNGAKVPFGVTNANVNFYVNKPANCRWSFADRDYDKMENNMTCATEGSQMNLRLSYTCSANLTGIKTAEKTSYYVKCQDLSPQNNTNKDYYLKPEGYTLQGSRALVITEASPNATTIYDSTSPASVTFNAKTLGGTQDGKAMCFYREVGSTGLYTQFDNSDYSSNIHSTIVPLKNGEHSYSIKCNDRGGNSDTQVINFNVSIDNKEPLIARAYYEDSQLKIMTNEKAECRYFTSSTIQCNYEFEDGDPITSYDQINHLAKWNTDEDLYIKCQDVYGNQPAKPNECSIILRAQNRNNL